MFKKFEKLSEKILPLAGKLGQNRYLIVLRDAFMMAFPLTMFGSIVTILTNIPFFPDEWNQIITAFFGNAVNATMLIMTVFVTFGIGYYLTESFHEEGPFGGVVALSSFLILTPFLEIEGGDGTVGLSLQHLGAEGMFVGMITGFLAGRIYVAMVKTGITIKLPEQVPSAVSKSFAAIIPAVVTLTIFVTINAIITLGFNTDLHTEIFKWIQAPLVALGSGLVPTLIAIFFIQILWFFGLHGQIIVNSVMDPIWNTLTFENLTAYTSGEAPSHIVNKQFIEIFTVGIGGTGMTLIVIIMLAFLAKSKQLKQVGRLAIAPGIFNVNEPIIFGLPIVLNPTIMIPWILAPMVVTTVTYFAMSTGLVPLTTGVAVPWTLPAFFSGMLATNSIRGGILQLVNIAIVGLIWYPFIKALDKVQLSEEYPTEL
ncbi:MAG: PTS cellobiose transporter subunit IIC [Staphylococcus equorum]|nr:PTS cellobiose transporter subunit IIC [Atopostipes sp.]MDN6572203.1 PTS cellobiose transporter subunit IIC [Staphylococcus equorum]